MMRLPFGALRVRDFMVEPLVETDAAALAELHREDFHRPWSQIEFESLMSQDTAFGYAVREVGNARRGPAGFVLARRAADEILAEQAAFTLTDVEWGTMVEAMRVELIELAKQGRIGPDLWMKGATGAPVSAEPLLTAAKNALSGTPE